MELCRCHRFHTMKKSSVLLCVLLVLGTHLGAHYLIGVDSTPVPPKRIYEDGDSHEELLIIKKISLPKNNMRTKRGIPCPKVDDTEGEWEIVEPCGCDPCDALKNAKEARMLRKQHRKIVAEMKLNRLKRKLHTAVCPKCALAHEQELEHKPCNKHVDITVVVPGRNLYDKAEVPAPMGEHPLPPPRQTSYTQVVQTGSQTITKGPEYAEPMVPEPHYGPMVPEPQYGPMVPEPQYGSLVPELRSQYGSMEPRPQYEPMVSRPQYGPMMPEPQYDPMISEPLPVPTGGYGPVAPWIKSAALDNAEKKKPAEELFEQDTKSKNRKAAGLYTIFLENLNTSTTEEPSDSEEAWPWKNATYDGVAQLQPQPASPINFTTEAPYDPEDAVPFNYTGPPKAGRDARAVEETSLRAPPTDDVLWQTAYLAASKAVAAAMNNSLSLDSLKLSDSFPVRRNCSVGQCTKLCLKAAGCLENEVPVRQKRDASSGMPYASALLTGIVSAIIGA